jgi:DNA-binding transcriptional MerR regulator
MLDAESPSMFFRLRLGREPAPGLANGRVRIRLIPHQEQINMTREVGYTIRAMATRCRMTAYTLRYYERVGLIQAVERGRNGHRRYSDADEAWLKVLQSLRATSMPIREIRRYAASRSNGVNAIPEQRAILEEHRRALEVQTTKLKEAIALLTSHIDVLQEEAKAGSPHSTQLSRWSQPEPYARLGKLLDLEPTRGTAFTSVSEPE